MTREAGRALAALALLAVVTNGLAAQDTVVTARPGLPIDTARVVSYRRAYLMIVHTPDSAIVVGEREVTMAPSMYAGSPAWMLVESRTGIVPAVETLYVAPDMRPLYWRSTQGGASLGATFVGDTILGATTTPAGRRSIILGGGPDLMVSQAMIEAMLALLPLTGEWTDSASVLAVDLADGSVIPVELSVIGEENVLVDSILSRPAWVVALRAEAKTILFWVDKESGEVHRTRQSLPSHIGSLLEYRRRADPAPAGR